VKKRYIIKDIKYIGLEAATFLRKRNSSLGEVLYLKNVMELNFYTETQNFIFKNKMVAERFVYKKSKIDKILSIYQK